MPMAAVEDRHLVLETVTISAIDEDAAGEGEAGSGVGSEAGSEMCPSQSEKDQKD